MHYFSVKTAFGCVLSLFVGFAIPASSASAYLWSHPWGRSPVNTPNDAPQKSVLAEPDNDETRSRRAPTDFLIIVGGVAEPVAPAEFSSGWGTGPSAGFQTGRWLSNRLALAVGVDYSRFGIDVVKPGQR